MRDTTPIRPDPRRLKPIRLLTAALVALSLVACSVQRPPSPEQAAADVELSLNGLQLELVTQEYREGAVLQSATALQAQADVLGVGLNKDGPFAKVGFELARLYREQETGLRASSVSQDRVVIDATAEQDSAALLRELEALGLEHSATFGRVVSGRLPTSAIADAAALTSLRFMRPALAVSRVGSVTSEGVAAMTADFGVDGSGVLVGVLSDSFDRVKDDDCTPLGGVNYTSYADDVATGDLPADVLILNDSVECASGVPGSLIDEGRAMAQLIYDVAPGSNIAFYTAFNGEAAFAQGILDLAEVGSDVIVDDIYYLAEPMFQDGIIGHAVDIVAEGGVPYFSAAGNLASRSYESPFRNSGEQGVFGVRHNFSTDPNVTQTVQTFTLAPGQSFFPILQWDEPYASTSPDSPGSASDIDLIIYRVDTQGNIVGGPVAGSFFNDIGADPIEGVNLVNTSTRPVRFGLVIELAQGAEPGLVKYLNFGSAAAVPTFSPAQNASTSSGHSTAAGGRGVGAAFWQQTPAFGVSPPVLEPFSSQGGIPKFFDIDGNRFATPEVRQQPGLTAPDGTSNTFFLFDRTGDGIPNFFGTSAAAPHAAGVAALQLDKNPDLTPEQVYAALEDTTIDMNTPGYDFASGFGLIQADGALGQYLSITSPTVQLAKVGQAFNRQLILSETGPVGRFTFAASGLGDIPTSSGNPLRLTPAGRLVGVVTAGGVYVFTVTVTDTACDNSGSCLVQKQFVLNVQ